MKVGLCREDALCWSKWNVGVNQIENRFVLIWPPLAVGDPTRFNILISIFNG